MGARALLISGDSSLVKSIGDAMASDSNAELEVSSTISDARRRVPVFCPTIIFAHVVDQADLDDTMCLLVELSNADDKIHLVAIADRHDAAAAVTLLRSGAADYLSRPVSLTRVNMLAEVLSLRPQPSTFYKSEPAVEKIGPCGDFLYGAQTMRVLVRRATRVAKLDSTVLLSGETGTGKTRLARLIHEMSQRAQEPFVTVNCGALAPSLIESELFGHVRGAFTGADRDRKGKCATAAGGTLLLDEVDSLPAATQSRLLRAVDERLFEPVGSDQSHDLRARLIFASNRSLEVEVREGRFREDLYYRINVLALGVPPLRDRKEEILPLARASIQHFAAEAGRRTPGMSDEVENALLAHTWPGNIRELRNVAERAVAFGGDRIDVDDLPESLHGIDAGTSHSQEISEASTCRSKWDRSRIESESQLILETLSKHANNRSKAARDLGISRVTLYKKLHKYGLI